MQDIVNSFWRARLMFLKTPQYVLNSTYCLLLTSFMLFSDVSASQFDKALELYGNGEYKKAGELWKKYGESSSDSGSSFHNVAELYKHGLGYAKNEGFAASWYKRAAAKGYLPSMYALGSLYYIEGSESIRHTNSSILWWEKAASLGDNASLSELARLYFYDSERRDLLRARSYARSALRDNRESGIALDIMQKTASVLTSLNLKGARQIHGMNPQNYMIELVSAANFNDAWVFVVKNSLQDAYIYRSVYNDYIVLQGVFSNVDSAFNMIANLPKAILALKPKPRSISVLQKEILPVVANLQHTWAIDSPDNSYTVELYRTDSMIDAHDFVDFNALSNSAVYRSKYGESVVIAGSFENLGDAKSVVSQLPDTLLSLHPKPVLIADVKTDILDDHATETSLSVN